MGKASHDHYQQATQRKSEISNYLGLQTLA